MIRTASLIAATISTGLTAGVFLLYAHTIMPGLRATDDHTFVAAFQSIDRSIINPWFLAGGFFGAVFFTALAALLHVGSGRNGALPWILLALALHVVVVLITMAVHLPLNDAIKGAGNPDTIDVDSVRQAFNESHWVAWNLVRVVLDLSAFALLTVSLVAHGRHASEPSTSAVESGYISAVRAASR